MSDDTRDDLLDDELPSEDELRDAMALARALERESVAESEVDALLGPLEASHLLRAARAPELSAERLDAIFAELDASLPPASATTDLAVVPPRGGLRALRVWWLGLAGTGLAAALALALVLREVARPEPAAGTLPAPSLSVLEAQLGALRRDTDAPQRGAPDAADGSPDGSRDSGEPTLARAMRPYRAELLAHLEAEYTR